MMSEHKTYSNRKTRDLVIMAVFMAIIFIQSWVPTLGYISFGAISLTFIHVTVIIATLWLGTKNGMIIGGVWGITAMIIAYLRGTPFERLVFTNPLISVLPRLLMPLILGLIASYLFKKGVGDKLVGMVGGVLGSLLNTLFVLSAVGLFAGNQFIGTIEGAQMSDLWSIIGGIIVSNGIPEAIFAGILTPLILVALKKAIRR